MAKARRKESVKLLGVARRKRAALMMSTALQATVVIVLSVPGFTPQAAAQPAPNARPTGGAVIAGSASISQAPAQTTINQATDRAALSWQTYNVGSQQSVVYHQPSASSVTLNRIDDPNPSQIAGRIDANGRIVLMNQAGVTFYKGAQVNTNGLMVTAASMSDSAMKGFVNTGTMNFDRDPNPNARVENRGNITIKQAGLAALVAPSVANSGTINAQLGHVVLAGANRTTVDMYGDGLVSIDVSGQVTKVPVGPDGKPVTALVTNTGVIRAEGGTVQLTARQADGLVTNLVDAGGRISANTVAGHTGVVALNGIGGGIVVHGQLSAAGRVAGSKGGDIEVNTDGNVTVASTARIDASGKAGGGNVAIGTTLARAKGGPNVTPTLTAAGVQVHKGAVVHADATAKGHGGRVTVLSTGTTTMDGLLTANGGPQGGDGGFVEVSGNILGFNGSVDVGAPMGSLGTVLFDPGTLDIVSGTSSSGSLDGSLTSTGTIAFGDGAAGADTVSNGAIQGVTGNLLLQATTLLVVGAPIDLTGAGHAGQSLTIESGGALTLTSGATITTQGNISLTASAADITGHTTTGALSVGAPVSTTQGTLALSAGTGGISLVAGVSAPTVDLTTGGSVAAIVGGAINAGTLVSSGGVSGSVSLTGSNSVAAIGSFAVSGSDFQLTNAAGQSLTVSGPLTASNSVKLSNSGTAAVTVSGSIGAGSGTVVLASGTGGIALNSNVSGQALDLATSGGGVTQSGGAINAGTLTSVGTVVGSVALNNGNTIGTIGAFAVSGSGNSFGLTNAAGQSIAITGPLTAPQDVRLATSGTGAITATGSIGATSGTLALQSGSGGIALNTGAILTAPIVALNSGAGAIALTKNAVLGQSGALVTLASGAGVTESDTAAIVAGTLQSSGTVTGDVVLGNANSIASISTFAVAGGSFTLVDAAGQALSVSGPLTADDNITLTNSGAAGITATGSLITETGTLALNAGDQGIALNAGHLLSGKAVTLSASGGGITQVVTGTIIAGTLQADALAAGGTVSLLGASNAIDNLAGFDIAEGGSFNLIDSSFLTVSGSVAALTNISLRSTNASGIEVTGSVGAAAGSGTASFQAAKLLINGGTVTGGTFEFAPISGGLTIGGASSALSSLAGIGTSKARIGRAGGITTATSITLGGTFDAKNQSLELDTSGGITDGGFALINVNTLSGTAGATVSLLNSSNAIGFMAGFTVTNGDLDLVDGSALTFSAGNFVNNGNAYVASSKAGGITANATGWLNSSGTTGIQADALTVLGVGYSFKSAVFELAPYHTGTIVTLGGAGSGLVLSTLNNVISAPVVRIGAVTVPGSGLTTTAGSIVVAGNFGTTFAGTLVALELDSKGGIDASGGALTASTLTGNAGGDVVLSNTGNLISNLGNFATSGNFNLVDAHQLIVNGTVAAGTVFAAAPNPANANTLNISITGSGNALTLGVASGAAGVLNSGTVTLAADGSITQPNGTIIANALGASSTTGAVNLSSSANNVTTMTGASAKGDLVLVFDPTTTLTGTYSGTNVFLEVAHTGDALQFGSGVLGATVTATAASGPRVSVVADQITEGAAASSITATNGTVEIAPFTAGTAITLGASSGSGLVVDRTLLGDISTGTGSVTVGRFTDANNGGTIARTGGNIALGTTADPGTVDLTGKAQTLFLDSSGTIAQPANGTVITGTLSGIASSVTLAGIANAITNLATFAAGQDFALTDGSALNVVGSVSAGTNLALTVLNGGSLAIGNSGTAGILNAGSTAALSTTGVITEDAANGTIIATTLTGPSGTIVASGATLFSAGNTISNLGDFLTDGTTGSFLLQDTHAINVVGTVTAGKTLELSEPGSGTISIGNSSTIGLLNAGTTGTVTLLTTGAISEDASKGSIVAKLLNGPTTVPTAADSVTLTNIANQVGTLGSFLTVNDFDFRNGIPLTLAGLVQPSAGSVFIQEAAGKGLSFNGGSVIVSGHTIGLVADSLSYTSGTIDAGLGTGGTVEIAPTTSGTAVGLGGGSGLVLSTAALGAISGNELRIGGYHDRANASAQTISAGSIDIAGNISLAATAVHRLRLDTAGAVTESTGTLSVGTLVGTAANGYTITASASNAIGTLGATGANGTLTATGGNIEIVDSTSLTVQNAVSAPAGNIFLQDGAGQTLNFLSGGSVVVSSGTIGLMTDLLSVTSGASISAAGGTVEIAPVTSGTTVKLAGSGAGLVIDSTALAAIQAAWLRIGGAHNQPGGGTNTVTAGSIDIAGLVNLGSSVVPALRLDSVGAISESGGPLNVQTLSVSTNSIVANVTLGNTLNNFATLDNVTVGGNLTLADSAGMLTLPTNAVVYGNNVTISNTGSVLVLGDLGAAAGTLSLGAGGDMTVGSGGNSVTLIGATGAATLTATGAFNQLGGLINANGVSISAGTTLTQSAGTIINAGTAAALVINGGSQFVQNAAGTIASNQDGTITAGASGSVVTNGTVLTAGSLALIANTFTQNAGTIAAGGNLLVESSAAGAALGGNILQAGGTMAAGQTLALIGNFTNSDASQTGGVLAGNTIAVTSATEATPFQSFAPAVLVSAGSNTIVACVCTGLVSAYTNPSPAAPGSTPSLPTLTASGASRPHHLLLDVIDVTTPSAGGYSLSQSIGADWVEIHTSGAFAEAAGGTITATLLSGTAGYAPTGSGPSATFTTPFAGVVSNATFNNSNSITDLGPYLATGDFRLTNANNLTVVDTIVAGGTAGGHVLALTAPGITVDQSGGVTTPNGLSITANGLLQALATTSSGTVTPGQVLLRTNALTLTPAAPGSTVVNAPNGLVAIAPLTSGNTIDLDASGTVSSGSTLVLTQAMLDTVNTLGSAGGTAGTQTLILGSLDGAALRAGRIDINTGIALPAIARNLVLDSTGAVQENAGGSLFVTSVAGTAGATALTSAAGSFLLANGNTIAELGNVATRIVGGTTYVSAGSPGVGLLNLSSTGDVRVTDNTGTLSVVGTVTANSAGTLSSGTIALTAPALQILAGPTTLATGTIQSAGSLLAVAGAVSSGTITPSRILLQADGLRIASNTTAAIVSAPSGEVAIAPLTAGRSMSIDAAGTLGGSTLSLGTTDLALIATMSGTLSAVTPGPTGTQTLALGSLDDGATTRAGGITINTQVTLGGTANLTGNTLALYSSGDVVETPTGSSPTGAVTVDTLIGTVTAGNIWLNGPNHFVHLGNLGTQAGFTTPAPVDAGVTAASGNVLIRNGQALNVVTVVQAGSVSPNYAELDVLGGGDLTVLNGGTVTAGDVYLRAGNSGTAGNVTVAAGGVVFANNNADLAAGVQYTAATPLSAPLHSYADGSVAGDVEIDGYVHAGATGTIGLYAHDFINEPGTIRGGVLTGFAGTYANLPGSGSPTANLIADLAGFTTHTGFLLRDGEALAVIGQGVTDFNTGITIAVAPATAADLALAAPVSAGAGTVKLEATGNVYETGAGSISNSGGTFTVTGGVVTAPTLVSQAGALPDTEAGGNIPSTIPGVTFGRAIDWFGNANSVATLGNVTATGNFLLNNGQNLVVAGTVIAGTLPLSTGTVAAAYPVVSGPFGTAPDATPSPFAEIDIGSGGNLTIAAGATLHVGLDGSLAGNATLRAGNTTNTGAVLINGDVFAANGGTVAVSAGFNPNVTPAVSAYAAGCDATTCGITINGVIWGDGTLASSALAGLVTLSAGSSIDETSASAMIGATTLTGFAGRHANLTELASGGTAAAVALNQIGTLGAFSTSNFAADAQGFALRDGRALTIAGTVQDFGTTASNISIAVMAGSGSTYSAADLLLKGNVTANQTLGAVSLQATGNIVQSAGSITTNSLVAEAGARPGTEATGTQPGTIAGSPVLTTGSIVLADQNQVSVLGNGTRGVSAEGDIRITNVPSLTIAGTIVSQNGTIVLTNTGGVTNNAIVNAVSQDVTITSPHNIANSLTIEAANNVLLDAGGNIGNGGLVDAIGGDATLLAGNNITNTGLVHAGHHVFAESGRTIAAGSIGNQGTIKADGTGSVGSPSIDLIALNSGNISQASTGTATATNVAGPAVIEMSANNNVTLDGSVLATGPQGIIGVTANNAFNQLGGTIQAGGTGTAGTPSIAITANTGTLGQAAGIMLATNAGSGYVALNAGTLDINTAGTVQATGTAGVVTLTAQRSINQTAGLIAAGGADTTTAGTPTITLLAQTGTIAQSSGAAILATNNAGTISLTTAASSPSTTGSITTAGSIIAAGASAMVTLKAGTSIRQSGGTILSGGHGTIPLSGAATPNLSLFAQNGTIQQSAGAAIRATNTAGVIGLHATGDISFAGSILAPGTFDSGIVPASMISAGISLASDSGSILQDSTTGVLQAGLLEGVAHGSVTLTGAPATGNLVANLGAFTAEGGNFVLTDDQNLKVSGPVVSNTGSVVITDTHVALGASSSLLNFTGSTIQGATGVTLVADVNITNDGTMKSVANDVTATATSGTLTNDNLISAAHDAVLTAGADIDNNGSALVTAGHFDILKAGTSINDIGTILAAGAGSSASPSIRLTANTGTIGLPASGTILASDAAGAISLNAPATGQAITLAGLVSASGASGLVAIGSGGSVTQNGGTIVAGGPGSSGTPSLAITAGGGTIGQTAGSILATNASGLIALKASTDIDTAGSIGATGTVAGAVTLIAGGSINQTAGTIQANGAGSIAASGSATPNLSLAANGGTIAQSAGAVIAAPNLAGVVGLHATGNMALDGSILAAGSNAGVSLVSTGGSIAQAAATGILQATTLIGASAGGVSLTGTSASGNLVGNLGSFASGTVGTGDFVLTDQRDLAVIGPVVANRGSVVITDTHLGANTPSSLTNQSTIQGQTGVTLAADVNVTNSGIIQAVTNDVSITASAGTLGNSGTINAARNLVIGAQTDLGNTGTMLASGNDALLTAVTGGLTNSGLISGAHNAVLLAHTNIGNTGTVQAVSNDASLTASTGVLTNGSLISAGQNAVLVAGTDIGNTGTVRAIGNDASLTAMNGALTNSGLISGAHNAVLLAHTNIGNTGTVQAIGNDASLTAGTNISNSGTIKANRNASVTATSGTISTTQLIMAGSLISLAAKNGANLELGGILSAPTITVDAGPNNIKLDGGASIVTGGTIRPSGSILAFPPIAITQAGAYLSAGSFQQTGASTVRTLSGSGNVLSINTQAGPIVFSSNGLDGPDTWLILNTRGTITGTINVKSVDVIYKGTTGGADLIGLVNTYNGHAAAGQGNIEPTKNANYKINGCPIASVNCVLLPTQGVPTANPLDELYLGAFFGQQDETDLLLPIVSDQDY